MTTGLVDNVMLEILNHLVPDSLNYENKTGRPKTAKNTFFFTIFGVKLHRELIFFLKTRYGI